MTDSNQVATKIAGTPLPDISHTEKNQTENKSCRNVQQNDPEPEHARDALRTWGGDQVRRGKISVTTRSSSLASNSSWLWGYKSKVAPGYRVVILLAVK